MEHFKVVNHIKVIYVLRHATTKSCAINMSNSETAYKFIFYFLGNFEIPISIYLRPRIASNSIKMGYLPLGQLTRDYIFS